MGLKLHTQLHADEVVFTILHCYVAPLKYCKFTTPYLIVKHLVLWPKAKVKTATESYKSLLSHGMLLVMSLSWMSEQ